MKSSTELLAEIETRLEALTRKGYDRRSFKSGFLLGYAVASNEDKWISVEDRLPEKYCQCLVASKYFNGDSFVDFAEFDHGEFYEITEEGDVFTDITHWTPPPEPPKTETK